MGRQVTEWGDRSLSGETVTEWGDRLLSGETGH